MSTEEAATSAIPSSNIKVLAETTSTSVSDMSVLQRAIAKLHSNLGHPGNRTLARAVRTAGSSDEAVSCALAYKCPVCARLKEPPPTLPSRLPVPRDFNDLVAIDLFTLGDVHGNVLQFINAVDVGSTFQIVAEVESKRPDAVLAAFLSCWVLWAGVPAVILTDGGGEFNAEFSEKLSDMGATMRRSAAYAPTQNSIVERHGSTGNLWPKPSFWNMESRFTDLLGDDVG